MKKLHKQVIVSHPLDHVFPIVANCENYPDFLPWCERVQLLSQTHTTPNQQVIEAAMTLKAGPIHQTLITRNQIINQQMVQMQLIKGPFKHLHGQWQFQAMDPQRCQIDFNIEFQFTNKLMEMAMGKMFDDVVHTLIDAFVTEADQRAKAID